MTTFKKFTVLSLCFFIINSVHADEIYLAVATNFTAAMKEIVTKFEQTHDYQVKTSFGSSGKIYAQIKHGAPFEIFLSADQTKPELLENEGFTILGSRFTYAIGALALWSFKPDFVGTDFTQLTNNNFNKLALANPKLAPYGVAAIEVLEKLKLKEASRAKWVQGENIAQTYQFVATGNADLGFVALSQIMDKGEINIGSSFIIPHELYSPIRQDAVLLKRAKNNAGAKALHAYIQSTEAKKIIQTYGYQTE
jgi:molybdate transport system substrate-binding protein